MRHTSPAHVLRHRQRTRPRLHCANITATRASRIPVASTHIAPMHQRALLLSLTASSAAAFVTPASVTVGTRPAALTRRWADDLDDAAPATEPAAPSLDAVETAVLNDALDTAAKQTAPKRKKKRPVDPERAATKFVKTATNPVTWKNGIYAGSLAIAVLLPVALLALAQK